MCITSFGKICFHWVLFPRGNLGGAISNILPHPFNPPCPTPLLPPRHPDTCTVCSPLLSGLRLSSYHLVLFWVLYCIIVILSKKRLRTKSQKIQNSSSIYGGLFEIRFFMDRRRIPHSTVCCVCGGGVNVVNWNVILLWSMHILRQMQNTGKNLWTWTQNESLYHLNALK